MIPHPASADAITLAPLTQGVYVVEGTWTDWEITGAHVSAPASALAYTLGEGQLAWESDPVSDVDVEALLSGPTPDRQERREVDEWLRQLLAEGTVDSRQVGSGVPAHHMSDDGTRR
jgi:hypothetical protein